jgi:hypothetical protein
MSNEASDMSPSGQPIMRHAARNKPFEPTFGDVDHIKLIEEHITRHLGAPETVFHELISDLVHIDVHILKPTPERNFYTLVTTGMSARAMVTPEGAEDYAYAELLLCLPPDWPLEQKDFENEDNYWPIRLLKMLARLPHEYDTWLAHSHTVPNGDPAEPYAPGTRFCGAILAPPLLAPPEFAQLRVSPEMDIHFWAVLPLYAEEMDLKLRKGADALFDLLDKHKACELVDVSRRNTAKKLFGLF